MNNDLLLKIKDGIFSYRIAGLLIQNDKILIQRDIKDTSYAFPGGHVAFGETSEQTLVREYKEELGVDISIDRMLWIQENFWKWGAKDCHQLCLYYLITLNDETKIPLDGVFHNQDQLENEITKLEFSWVDLSKLKDINIYPKFAKEKVLNLPDHIEHLIVVE